jgi:hypothetical protein
MRAFLLASIIVLGMAAGLQTTGAAPSLPSNPNGAVSRNMPAASHQCGKGQRWVPSGYAKHGKYRVGHCAAS